MGTEAVKMINDWQRKRIFQLARELGMSTHSKEKDDDLHLLVDAVTERESLTTLTYGEATKVIAELEHRGRFGSPLAPKKKTQHPIKPGGISVSQQKKIWAMMYELRSYDELPNSASLGDRLAGIIRKELHIDATEKNPFAWLNAPDSHTLIDKTLKNYIKSAKKAAAARSGVG